MQNNKKIWIINSWNRQDWLQHHNVVGSNDKVIFVGRTTNNAHDLSKYLYYLPGEKVLLPHSSLNRRLFQLFASYFDEIKHPQALVRVKVQCVDAYGGHKAGGVAKIGVSNYGKGDYVLVNIRAKDIPSHMFFTPEQLLYQVADDRA